MVSSRFTAVIPLEIPFPPVLKPILDLALDGKFRAEMPNSNSLGFALATLRPNLYKLGCEPLSIFMLLPIKL